MQNEREKGVGLVATAIIGAQRVFPKIDRESTFDVGSLGAEREMMEEGALQTNRK